MAKYLGSRISTLTFMGEFLGYCMYALLALIIVYQYSSIFFDHSYTAKEKFNNFFTHRLAQASNIFLVRIYMFSRGVDYRLHEGTEYLCCFFLHLPKSLYLSRMAVEQKVVVRSSWC